MSKIKQYFKKKKEEAAFKFKLGASSLGQGHSLSSSNQDASSSQRNANYSEKYVPPKRKELSSEARAAADAALSRVQKRDPKVLNTSLAAIKAQAKRELEAEAAAGLRQEGKNIAGEPGNATETKSDLACQGVFFRCPLVSDEVLPKKEWKIKIKEFLYQQLESNEKALTSCLIILNCNVKEKVSGYFDLPQDVNKYVCSHYFRQMIVFRPYVNI